MLQYRIFANGNRNYIRGNEEVNIILWRTAIKMKLNYPGKMIKTTFI
jgi:hypothetical protein